MMSSMLALPLPYYIINFYRKFLWKIPGSFFMDFSGGTVLDAPGRGFPLPKFSRLEPPVASSALSQQLALVLIH